MLILALKMLKWSHCFLKILFIKNKFWKIIVMIIFKIKSSKHISRFFKKLYRQFRGIFSNYWWLYNNEFPEFQEFFRARIKSLEFFEIFNIINPKLFLINPAEFSSDKTMKFLKIISSWSENSEKNMWKWMDNLLEEYIIK